MNSNDKSLLHENYETEVDNMDGKCEPLPFPLLMNFDDLSLTLLRCKNLHRDLPSRRDIKEEVLSIKSGDERAGLDEKGRSR
jgi:hypothetical protein